MAFPQGEGTVSLMRTSHSQGVECQKESIVFLSVTKRNVFIGFADGYFSFSVLNRKKIHMYIYIRLLLLTKFPQKRCLFSARARTVCRNKHFFSPHCVAKLSACRRIPLLFSGKGRPKGGISACFSPLVFLFGAGKALPAEKQKGSWQG